MSRPATNSRRTSKLVEKLKEKMSPVKKGVKRKREEGDLPSSQSTDQKSPPLSPERSAKKAKQNEPSSESSQPDRKSKVDKSAKIPKKSKKEIKIEVLRVMSISTFNLADIEMAEYIPLNRRKGSDWRTSTMKTAIFSRKSIVTN
jgi:hypothetical protein